MGMTSPYSVSFVFPAYNEEGNIGSTVRDAAEVAKRLLHDYEIVVVDDGSQDRTAQVLTYLRHEFPSLRVVRHEKNRGYGAALRSGFEAARKDLVFFSDSDGQFDLSEVELLLPHVESYDIVTGYRHSRSDPIHRRMNAFGWNTLVRLALGTGVRDINCAFKIFRRGIFDRLMPSSDGALVNAEILGKARRLGMTVHEVPVTHLPREVGEQTGAKPRVVLRAFYELFQLYGEIKSVAAGPRPAQRGYTPLVPLPTPKVAVAAAEAVGGSAP
jgi:glycosyltransferase involved in cell wall biosynthesis